MHLILTGATGSVGYPVLQRCLATPAITQLSILSRRPFTIPSSSAADVSKAKVIIHEDYESYPPALLAQLKGATACIWAQGISQNQVNKSEYVKITHSYPMAAAKAFAGLPEGPGGRFNFVYVSGEGADVTEKTWTLFGKIKGRCEKDLVAFSSEPAGASLRVFNVRPGYVDPSVRPVAVMTYVLAPLLRGLAPSMVSPVAELSKVLVDLALGDGEPLVGDGIEAGGRTIRSNAIRRLGPE
ncbi:hypothetical protein HDU86_001296 [Geranomyces michiganensis]|nr:hypothetical protein HDU86_001296 [Geranomyces michiganensis]